MATPPSDRDLIEHQADGDLRIQARAVLESWTANLPELVEPKF
jgi:hypothetical protein